MGHLLIDRPLGGEHADQLGTGHQPLPLAPDGQQEAGGFFLLQCLDGGQQGGIFGKLDQSVAAGLQGFK